MASSKGITVWSIWAEWDLGINDELYSTFDKAHDAVEAAFESCGMDYSIDEAMNRGLVSFNERAVQ